MASGCEKCGRAKGYSVESFGHDVDWLEGHGMSREEAEKFIKHIILSVKKRCELTCEEIEEGEILKGCGVVLFCSCCGCEIKMSQEQKKKVLDNCGRSGIESFGIIHCHLEKKSKDYDSATFSFDEYLVMRIDHPSFCKHCVEFGTVHGWEFIECGCGG